MKTWHFLPLLVLAVILTGCSKKEEVVHLGKSNFFSGQYAPMSRLQHIVCSEHVEGVECGEYDNSNFMYMDWHWSAEHLDSIAVYDSRINTIGPQIVRCHYDSEGRLSRVVSDVYVLNHVCSLHYEGSRLSSIDETFNGWHCVYSFGYDGSDYPETLRVHYSVEHSNDVQEVTDTYTLRWRNGNLMSAVCWPGNDAYSFDSITYCYANCENPFCGLLTPNTLRRSGIVNAPIFVSRNIPVSVTFHLYDNTSMQTQSFTPQFDLAGGVPTFLAHQYEDGIWCNHTDTYALQY